MSRKNMIDGVHLDQESCEYNSNKSICSNQEVLEPFARLGMKS